MLRADIFAALCISDSALFLQKVSQSQAIKKGVLKSIQTNNVAQLEELDIFRMLKGFNRILFDMSFRNTINNIKVVNMDPGGLRKMDIGSTNEMYIYAAVLPPGRHNLLIYCPQQERAFVKQFYVGLNTTDPVPEFPRCINAGQRNKIIQNMWRPWVDDDIETNSIIFTYDTTSKHFEPELIIKDQE
jgi:hypothetical protein